MGIVRENDPLIPSFQKRANDFFERFPESVFFRRIEFDDSNPSGVIDQVKMLTGITDERNAERVKVRRQIRSRKLPVPYFMLNRFLPDVKDLFSAWSRQISYAECASEYKVFRNRNNKITLGEHFKRKNKVLFDQTSLLVLSDIGILDLVLDSMPGICMIRDDYEKIIELAHPIFGSLSSWLPEKIKASLSKRLGRITFLALPDEENNLPDNIASLIEEDDLLFCTDDSFVSLFVNKNDYTINSDDILLYLVDTRKIDESQFFDAYTSLCNLGMENITPCLQALHLLTDFYISEVRSGNQDKELAKAFLSVIDAATSQLHSDQAVIEWYASFFSIYLNQGKQAESATSLYGLLVRMLFRLQRINRNEALARWFVYACHATDYKELSEFLKCGIWQHEYFSVVKDLYGQDWNKNRFFYFVSKVICERSEIESSDIFDKVRLSVVEGTDDSELLARVYTQTVLQTRLNEANKASTN